MTSLSRESALSAVQTLLGPLASFVLKCGLSYREFAALAKTAFVAAATNDYGIQGRPTNISRVSLLTGIARKEVKRQRDTLKETRVFAEPDKTTDATRVLSGWHQDKDFSDKHSTPRDLKLSEFEELCRRYCSDIPPSAIAKELKRVGAVVAKKDGRLKAMSRYYMPVQTDAEWIMNAGHYIADLSDTINYNMEAGDNRPTRFAGRATETRIAKESVAEFREFMEQAGQEFLESVDAWLTENRIDESPEGDRETVRLGAGVFVIQDEKNN